MGEWIIGIPILLFCLIFPLYLTIANIIMCVRGPVLDMDRRLQKIYAFLTIFVGLIMYGLLTAAFNTYGDWYEAVYPDEMHNMICSEYLTSFYIVLGFGIAGLCTLAFMPANRLPPLISALAVGFTVILNVLSLFVGIHIIKGLKQGGGLSVYFYIYHFNILLLSVYHIRNHIKEQLEIMRGRGNDGIIYKTLSKAAGMSLLCFAMIFVAAAILLIIMILTGQGADGIVKAFTMTADWTFSTQIPPPPLEYSGHYLCTVAAGGHKKIVKPLRFGKRRGAVIIVNRQLCIANAFEELIHDISPKFHKQVRGFYDKHGYPLSRLITTPLRADIVYILMKPLEWIFLITLYALDADPEKRIARQYEYKETLI